MNLKQIETFIWIARLGSFAAAGQRLNTTQSAISTRIHELELDLGVQLFVRGRRAASLTAKGQELLGMAEALMDQVWEIQSSIGQTDAISGMFRIGVADLIAVTWLSQLVKDIQARYKRVKLDLRIGLAKELIEMLRAGELDIVLSPGKTWTSEFDAIRIGEAEFLWMVNADSPVPTGTLTPRELRKWPIITLSVQSYHHRLINRWFRENRASSRNYIECNSIAVIGLLTASGLGVGLLPTYYVRDQLKSGELRILDCDPPIAPIGMYAFIHTDTPHPLAIEIALMAKKSCPLSEASFVNTAQQYELVPQ